MPDGRRPVVRPAWLSAFSLPGSLRFVNWIDIERQTSAFAVMWRIIDL
jgi:hypothetical protein